MSLVKRDFSIFNRFEFDKKPTGIKFLLNKPEGIELLDGRMPICRMLGQALNGRSFYAGVNNFSCMDKTVLGMEDADPIKTSGQIGAKENIYQEARANGRLYQYIEKIPRNTVRYVAFSPVDGLSFDPDLLVIAAVPNQAEIILRALSFSTGKPLTTKCTPVLMCAWIFAYPFMTGELNYVVTGIGYGMRSQKILPEGLFLISVPYDLVPMLLENLHNVPWTMPITTMNEAERSEYSAKIMAEIKKEYENG